MILGSLMLAVLLLAFVGFYCWLMGARDALLTILFAVAVSGWLLVALKLIKGEM